MLSLVVSKLSSGTVLARETQQGLSSLAQMASLLLAVMPSEFGWMPTDLAGILLKNPFDWVQITSVLINPEICLSIHRVEQLFNLVDLVLDTKNKKHPVYAWEP
jgi:hypothetical protein